MTRPILVTGAHRSGTTWIGKMLALAPGVAYIHEPFNPVTRTGISGAPFEHYFTVVSAENEGAYLPHLERTFRFEYGFGRQLSALRSPRDAVRSTQDAFAFARARSARARPLAKDPIALLSAEWLAERFDMDVVVTIRHPAAFAASVIRLGWTVPFERLLGDERLSGFEPELQRQAAAPGDPLEQAALVWRVFYSIVDGYRERHSDWTFVRHEDASRAPLETFGCLYERLGLELTPHARRGIERHSAPGNPVPPRSRHAIRADSAANADSWRAFFSAADVARLREVTSDVWPRFYSDDDW